MNTQTMGGQSRDKANGSDFQIGDIGGGSELGNASPEQHAEGKLAKAIEEQTAKLPSDTFLWAAVGAIGASAVCELSGWKDKSRFFGQWVAPLLLFGVYNKLVKVQGHDRASQ